MRSNNQSCLQGHICNANFVQKCTSIAATNDECKVFTRHEVDDFLNAYHEHKFEPRITHRSITSPEPASRKKKSRKKRFRIVSRYKKDL
jgi:hypothetical protein